MYYASWRVSRVAQCTAKVQLHDATLNVVCTLDPGWFFMEVGVKKL